MHSSAQRVKKRYEKPRENEFDNLAVLKEGVSRLSEQDPDQAPYSTFKTGPRSGWVCHLGLYQNFGHLITTGSAQ